MFQKLQLEGRAIHGNCLINIMMSTLIPFRDIGSNPSVSGYKTKKGHKFLNQILVCQLPSFSILVGSLILLNAVRNSRFG